MTKNIVNIAVVLLLFLITFITSSIAENQSQNLRIYVVNYPLKWG